MIFQFTFVGGDRSILEIIEYSGPTVKLISSDPTVEGAYLVETLAHCGECHTSRNLIGGLQYEYWLGGEEPRWERDNTKHYPAKLHWRRRK